MVEHSPARTLTEPRPLDTPFARFVIVPLDGSREAESAIPVATAFARDSGATVVLVSVTDDGGARQRDEYLREQQTRFGVDATRVLIDPPGPPEPAIVDLAAQYESPLLCLASHGRNGLGRALMGSDSEAIAVDSGVPAVLVGPCCETSWPDPSRLLLVPLDGSTRANRVLPLAIRTAQQLDLEPVLVHVAHPLDIVTAGHPHEALREAEEAFSAAGLAVADRVVFEDPAREAVAAYAQRRHAALIVMSTRHRTGAPRLVRDSVAMATVRRATCPVLLREL